MQDERVDLMAMIDQKFKSYDRWSKTWSFMYQSFLIISALASAGAALVLKLDSMKDVQYQTDISAILAGLAAVLTTLIAAGGFDRKWRVSRASRNSIEQLKINLTNPDFETGEIRAKLVEILQTHNEGVSGSE